MTEFFVVQPGPRPAFAALAEALWPGSDFDSDGDSFPADSTSWTELTLQRRPEYDERIDVDPVRERPLVLRISANSETLAERAAKFLSAHTGGRLARTCPNA